MIWSWLIAAYLHFGLPSLKQACYIKRPSHVRTRRVASFILNKGLLGSNFSSSWKPVTVLFNGHAKIFHFDLLPCIAYLIIFWWMKNSKKWEKSSFSCWSVRVTPAAPRCAPLPLLCISSPSTLDFLYLYFRFPLVNSYEETTEGCVPRWFPFLAFNSPSYQHRSI